MFRIIKLKEIEIDVRSRNIDQTFNIILRINIHLDVRRKIHEIDNFESK